MTTLREALEAALEKQVDAKVRRAVAARLEALVLTQLPSAIYYAKRSEPHENWEDEVVPWVAQRLEEFGQVSIRQLWDEDSDIRTITAALGRLMYENRVTIIPSAINLAVFASSEGAQLDWDLIQTLDLDDPPEVL